MIKIETNLKKTNIPWIPEIPSNWDLKRIKLLFDFNKNIVGKSSADYSVLSLTTKGVIRRDLESGMGKFPASFDGYQIVNPNSIMLCLFDMDVTPRVVGHVNDKGIISAAYTNIIPRKGINSKYYYYYFLLQDKNKIFLALGTGIRITLSKDVFGCLKIPVPPLEIQNRIVEYLDKKNSEIDKFIQNKDRLIELLEEEKQSEIERCISFGLNSNCKLIFGRKEIPRYPSHWHLKKTKHLFSIFNGYAFSTDLFISEGVQVLKISSLYQNKLSLDRQPTFVDRKYLKKLNQFIVSKGDILLSLTGTLGKKDYGYAVQLKTDDVYLLNQRVAKLIPKPIINSDFLLYLLRNDIFLNQLYMSPCGTKQANLSNSDLLSIHIAIPEIEEQKQIANHLNKTIVKFDLAISKAQNEIAATKEYREALITDLVTGKRSIPQT